MTAERPEPGPASTSPLPGSTDAPSAEPAVRWFAIILGALAVLAFVVRLVGVIWGRGLDAMLGSDDAVYFTGAVALVEGRLPYRDFNTLHPPGIFYLLAPFGALAGSLGETAGFAAARVSFMLLGALNTVLVGLVGRRLGPWTGLVAAAIYAVWNPSLVAERTTYLIAPQSALLLLAVYQLTARPLDGLTVRRAAVAGVCLGIAGTIQIWAAIPAMAILVWLVVAARSAPRRALRLAVAFVASGAATAAALLAPMLALTGERMVSMVVFAQASRVGSAGPPVAVRLQFLEGIWPGWLARVFPDASSLVLLLGVGLLVLYAAWRRPAMRPWVGLLAAQTAFLMITPVFFGHYAAWTSPLASLSIGATVTYFALFGRPPVRTATVVATGLALAVLLVASVRPVGRELPVTPTTPDLSAARCVTADRPHLLIASRTLIRSLRNGCRLLPNPRSASHVYDVSREGPRLPRRDQTEYQDASLAYYTSGDVALFGRLDDLGLTKATLARIRAELPVEERVGFVLVLRRTEP